MTDLVSFKNKLLSVIPITEFVLDDRSVLSHLKLINQYAMQVPYKSGGLDGQKKIKNWAEYLFMGEGSPDKLAEIYKNPSSANGELLPHQTLLLAMLKMLETPKVLMNHFPHMHREFYYRECLQLEEKLAEPSKVAISIKLDKASPELMLPAGTLFDAGQDHLGNLIEFSLDRDLLANQSALQELRYCYPVSNNIGNSMSAVVHDIQNAWPDKGIRLFADSQQGMTILTGQILVSNVLMSDSLSKQEIVITFTEPLSTGGMSAHISGEGDWVSLVLHKIDDKTAKLTFPSDQRITRPEGLSNLTFDSPVIRISRQDNSSVPEISAVSINNRTLHCDEYYTRVLTPFGHSNEYQPTENRELYLGINEILPGQTLSLFWEINAPQPLSVCWKYLASNNHWCELGGSLIDGTQGLLKSGLWSAILPEDASNIAPAMPSGCYWIRAEIEPVTNVDSIGVTHYPWLSGVLTNGMTTTLKNWDTADHSASIPLPAGTIRHLVKEIRGVSKVLQPWTSWDGKPQESSKSFFERTAQRLSHRNRALTWPDIVMLLKSLFPDVYEVMTPSKDTLSSVPALSVQKLVAIPLNSAQDNDDPLRPLFNAASLSAMRDALQRHGSLWQNIDVQNPRYRNVDLSYQVVLREGVNRAWAEQALRKEIVARYMPWSVSAVAGASSANRIDYYEVVATLQRQSYVDHVISLSLDSQANSIQGDDDEVLILCWPEDEV